MEENNEPVETHKTEYFGCQVKVWRIRGPYWGCAPWRFSIIDRQGVERNYVGVPNYLESKQQALKKAWWRAKWLANGTYQNHYKVQPGIVRGACHATA